MGAWQNMLLAEKEISAKTAKTETIAEGRSIFGAKRIREVAKRQGWSFGEGEIAQVIRIYRGDVDGFTDQQYFPDARRD